MPNQIKVCQTKGRLDCSTIELLFVADLSTDVTAPTFQQAITPIAVLPSFSCVDQNLNAVLFAL